MVEKKGDIGIVFDNNGGMLFFLILHRNFPGGKSWELLKGMSVGEQNPEEAMNNEIKNMIGLRFYKIKKKMDFTIPLKDGNDTIVNDVFLVETSMNTPVKLDYDPNKINTYLWANQKTTLERLSPEHRALVEKAIPEILKISS